MYTLRLYCSDFVGKAGRNGPIPQFPEKRLFPSLLCTTWWSAELENGRYYGSAQRQKYLHIQVRHSRLTLWPSCSRLTENRKRLPTASDSDTESPAKIPRLPSAVHAELARIPALKKPQKSKSDWVLPAVHTDHDLHGGPGWVDVSADKRDGLDDMISGLKNGSIPEETAMVHAVHCLKSARPSDLTGRRGRRRRARRDVFGPRLV